MILEIVSYGHPALRTIGRKISKVDDRIRQLAVDMIDTIHANELVGMAAHQIGNPVRMIVLNVLQNNHRPSQMWEKGKSILFDHLMPLVVINPEIQTEGELKSEEEGNPCVPSAYGPVERPERVTLRGYSLDNEFMEFTASDLLARAIQHEFDHLEGILITDRMGLNLPFEIDCKLINRK